MKRTQLTYLDHILAAVLMASYVALLLSTAPEVGISRDESMYVQASESYGRWYEMLATDPGTALEQKNIDAHFRANHEHPGLTKTLFAFSHLLHKRFDIFDSGTTAHRFPGMLSAGLLLWLIYIMGATYGGRLAGLGAALTYAVLPRPFYHAHLNCFDVPITLAVTLCAFAYGRSLTSWRYVVVLGASFGLALATKHNSWILPGLFLIHFVYLQISRRWTGRVSLSRVPWFLVSMTLLGPPILVLTWPWLWHDGLERFAWYARFHMKHDYYNMAYFGFNHFRPPFPIHFPLIMTAITVPATTLLLSLLGLCSEAVLEFGKLRRLAPPEPEGDGSTAMPVLWLGCLAAPLLLIALPNTPIFGGTKHWMTAYPFLCLFAGLGVALCARSGSAWINRQDWACLKASAHRLPLARHSISALAVGAAVIPGGIETAHSHPFGLSHYGVVSGGVPGAADLGMNRQFWGFTTGSLSSFFLKHLPKGGRVYICDTTPLAFHLMQKDGLLPKGLRAERHLGRADYAIVHHEHHFAEVDFQLWTAYGSVQPAYVLHYDGVPIISVYKNPHRQ